MVVLHYYQRPSEGDNGLNNLLLSAQTILGDGVQAVQKELCFNVNWTGKTLPSSREMEMLQWVFGCPFEKGDIAPKSFLSPRPSDLLVEIGPRLNFSTAYSTNAVSMCLAAGLENIDRVECSRRYLFKCDQLPTSSQEIQLIASHYDRMTEQTYPEPINSFAVATHPEAVFHVDILGEGRAALVEANNQLGLAFDSWDLDFYTTLFQKLGRNPTSVECFDLAQSNSEHSRHWFFKGRLLVDGKEMKESLFESIMKTQERSNPNNVIKFCDNSSSKNNLYTILEE